MKNKVLKYVLLFFLVFSYYHNGISQGQSEPIIDKDLWYSWLDATMQIDGKEKHFVSDELQEIYCCVRSRRYRKYLKKLEKELKEKIDSKFKLEDYIKKINHPTLAKELLEKAKQRDNVVIIKLKTSCP